jgi:signal transduction histidine kinase
MSGHAASREEIAALLKSTDWAATPLGPRAQWPKTLEGYVSMILEMPTPGIVFWGPEQTQIYNAGYAAIMGPRHPKYFGGSYRECWPDTYPTIYPWMRKVLDHGETIEVERAQIATTRRGWTEESYFTFTFSPLRDDEGVIRGIFQPVVEVTSSVIAERRSATRRDLARATLAESVATLGANRADLPFLLVYLRRAEGVELAAAIGLEGSSRAEKQAVRAIATRAAFEVPIDHVVDVAPVGALGERVRTAMVLPLEQSRFEGHRGAIICGISPILELDASYREFLEAITHDLAAVLSIEERQRAEKALLERERSARAEAEEANRVKDEFLATISHELRTPLNAILGWSSMLAAGKVDDVTQKNAIETIERNARAQARIVEDVLDVSRIVSGKLALEIARVELAAVVQAAVDVLRPAALAKSVRLEVDVEGDDPLPLAGDAGRLQQVVWNLVSNAIKYTPAGGTVLVAVEREQSNVVIAVHDTGIGIPPEHLPHVFERFRQVDSSTTRKHGGLGLGLAIVRHLVELHGGTVVAESDGAGRGSSFTVSLPVHAVVPGGDADRPPTSAATAGAPAEPLAPSLVGTTVLVVDDEEDSRDVVCAILEQDGAAVLTAGSADEAMTVMARTVPDALVSDIAMPDEDGYVLVQRVRRLPASRGGAVPAIALTAYARAPDRDRAIAAGFQHHLSKPVDPAELVAIVASVARKR